MFKAKTYFDFERTRLRSFKKRVVHTNLDIYPLLGLLYYSSPFSQHSSFCFLPQKVTDQTVKG